MAVLTDEERLAELKEAIHNVVVGGQSKTVRGKSITYASLAEMRKEIAILEAKINSHLPAHTYIQRCRF